jgi:hypothetical protein
MTSVFEAELARHDWAAFACGCGRTAAHIPATFKAILDYEGQTGGPSLTDHVEVETNLFAAAVPAVSVMLAALSGPISAYAREEFLNSLWYISTGEPDPSEDQQGATLLAETCRERMREGIWTLYQVAFSKRHAETALEILEIVDGDRRRFKEYRARLGSR